MLVNCDIVFLYKVKILSKYFLLHYVSNRTFVHDKVPTSLTPTFTLYSYSSHVVVSYVVQPINI